MITNLIVDIKTRINELRQLISHQVCEYVDEYVSDSLASDSGEERNIRQEPLRSSAFLPARIVVF